MKLLNEQSTFLSFFKIKGSLRKHIQTTHADVILGNNSSSSSFTDNTQQSNSQVNFLAQMNNNDLVLNSGSFNSFNCTVCKQVFTSKKGKYINF